MQSLDILDSTGDSLLICRYQRRPWMKLSKVYPLPLKWHALIKEIGTPFSLDYLATTDFVDRYNTSFQMAYMLGVFGADLGYLNIYNKNTQIVDYLTAINKLADGIRVGQFFDFAP